MGKTTAAPPSRIRRNIGGIDTDVIEIGSRRPLVCLRSGEGNYLCACASLVGRWLSR